MINYHLLNQVSVNKDSLLENCVDARNKLESISNWLSSKIMKLEKKVKSTNLIKIHETARSDPILIGTKRRVTMLKAELDKANKKTVDLTYTDFSESHKHLI